MAISRRLRFEILRRDNYTCRYCGSSSPDVTLTVDHVVPTALGGGDEPTNLVTACTDCNSGKSSVAPDQPIVEDVDATAMLFAKAIERANAIRRSQIEQNDAIGTEFNKIWLDWCPWKDQGNYSGRPNDWATTIDTFVENGLGIRELNNFVYTAFMARGPGNRDRWRYFCGCCWKEIGRRQEMARQLLEDGEV